MKSNLLIIGAGIYALVAKEIAESMCCFDKIDFADDARKTTPDGTPVVATTAELAELSGTYPYMIVAIGNPNARLSLLDRIERETTASIATLISPRAFISPSAVILQGSIIEPMAVIHTGAIVSRGCLVSAGAVVNHASLLSDGVHIDCNATVKGNTLVPRALKVESGEVFSASADATPFEPSATATSLHPPIETADLKYNFDDVM